MNEYPQGGFRNGLQAYHGTPAQYQTADGLEEVYHSLMYKRPPSFPLGMNEAGGFDSFSLPSLRYPQEHEQLSNRDIDKMTLEQLVEARRRVAIVLQSQLNDVMLNAEGAITTVQVWATIRATLLDSRLRAEGVAASW